MTLTGGDGDYPPTDEAGFLDCARTLPPDLYEVIKVPSRSGRSSATARPKTACGTTIAWALAGRGLVALGDAVCALNPVYGQGMTTAALAPRSWTAASGGPAHRGASCRAQGLKFQRELARTIAVPWLLATGTDYRYRGTEGPPRRRSTRMMHHYVDALIRLSTRKAGVRRRLTEVFHLLRPPSALFGPGVLGPLAWDWLTNGAAE